MINEGPTVTYRIDSANEKMLIRIKYASVRITYGSSRVQALLASCWWADKIGFPCTGRASPLDMKRHVEIKILGGLREDKDSIGL